MSCLIDWLAIEAHSKGALNLPNAEAKRLYWKRFERQREGWYKWAEAQLKKHLRREVREIADAIGDRATITPADAERIVNFNTDSHDWFALLSLIHRTVAADFAERAYADLTGKSSPIAVMTSVINGGPPHQKVSADPWWDGIEAWIDSVVADKVVMILGTTKTLIKKEIEEGIAAGEGVFEISQRVESLMLDQIIPHRSEVIARTEVIAASNAGSRAAAVATGMKLNHEWLATGDQRTRDAHATADGQTVPLDEPFSVDGEQLMFPGDTSLGATGNNVIQCRCAESYSVVR